MADQAVSDIDPFARFAQWYADAEKAGERMADAMTLATVDSDHRPNARMVLLKGVDEHGFVFYTNLESVKGGELAHNPHAALVFHWKSLDRQVRVRGPVSAVPDAEADAYFASRPRGSQIGAWASDQSRPLESALALEKKVAKMTAKFGVSAIPRPPHWSGFRLQPVEIEFWTDRKFRLHERLRHTRPSPEQDQWTITRLYP